MLLHHAFGEVNGKKRLWGHAIGGMGAITQAMARAAASHGVEIETDVAVREVLVEEGRAAGVVLADGRVVRGAAVAANVDPKRLYTGMISRMARSIRTFFAACARGAAAPARSGSTSRSRSCRALRRCPGTRPPIITPPGSFWDPSLGYMDRALCNARMLGWSREPIIELVIPSTLDDTLAPRGAHVASLFCQHVAPELPDGGSWNDHRESVADLMIETVDRYAPGFKASVVGRRALSPLDLEQVFGLTGGDIFHGALSLDQLFSARPALGYADYRGPLKGLYHCGSGAHPGGGVTGAPGHNAARAIIADRRWRFL